ncbi:hypothetical protein E4T50_11567 [Aureobasidium sp. EXF-12298]|nr:hypothetical protein E4T50_11567 [Aureobasidium sp. EXF-12298]
MVWENSTPSSRLMIWDSVAFKSKLRAFSAESIKLLEQSTPAAGRKNEAWLDCRTAERKIITGFWDQARVTLREELTFTRLEQKEVDDAISVISVSNNVEYAKIVENERLQVSDAIAAAAALTKSTVSTAFEEGFRYTHSDVSTLVIGEREAKPKTRPSQSGSTAIIQATPLELDIDLNVESTNPRHISATPRALQVVKKMYPTSNEESSARDTEWDLFVHAMNDLGFRARNVGGSGVAFEHTSKKKIIFHRPHPVAKIDSIMLQSMGKRLKKHFGWCRETFVEI